jgi:hypothetical protein
VALPLVVAGVVVGFVAGALAEIGPASGPYRRAVDRGFAALAASVATESDATGSALASLLAVAPTLQRPVLFAELDGLATAAAREQASLDRLATPGPRAGAGCLAALAGRSRAVSAVRNALQGVLGGTTGTDPLSPVVATSELESAAAALSAADAAWAACRAAVRSTPGRPRLPASRWVAGPAWSAGALAALVGAVTSSSTLAARQALAITTFVTSPPLLGGPASAQLAPTRQVTVHLVVTDTGNVDEPTVLVTATVIGAPHPEALSARVSLRAGTSVAVVLGPLALSPGGSYTLELSAAPPSGAGAAVVSTPLAVAALPTTTTTTTTTVPPRRS